MPPPRILAVHNHYQIPGGEDRSHRIEIDLLRAHGHRVTEYVEDNARVRELGLLRTAGRTIWSREAARRVQRLYRESPFDVLYVQNFFPLLSPSIYYAAASLGVPVVQNLRNYRLLCPGAYFFRDQQVCEACHRKTIPLPAIRHACYRDSRLGSATVVSMLALHRLLGTWTRSVEVYVALTDFARQKYIEGGLPAAKVMVRPNFLHPDPGPGDHRGSHALFVGRLSREKGIATLLEAFRSRPAAPLRILGEGPLRPEVEAAARATPNIDYLGARPHAEMLLEMQHARYLVFPSEWYEGMPRTLVEALATGLPVIASDLGAMSTMIAPERTGLLFPPGNPHALATHIDRLGDDAEAARALGTRARAEYREKYTAERNYGLLAEILDRALAGAKRGVRAAPVRLAVRPANRAR